MKLKWITSKRIRRKIIPYLRRPLAHFCMAPSFLIIGAQKSGSTSMFNYLIQHPDIKPPVAARELHYFDLRYNLGPKWYKSNFPFRQRGKITGEKSPYYIYHPLVPGRVFAFDNKLRLIVVLRDPVNRAYSHFKMVVRNGLEARTFRRALEEEMEKVESEHDRLSRGDVFQSMTHARYSYMARGRYVDQLDLWTRFFPKEQMYIVTFERFSHEPQTVCSEIFHFLGLSPARIFVKIKYNVSPAYEPMIESDKKWLSDLFYESNCRLADSYGVTIEDWT